MVRLRNMVRFARSIAIVVGLGVSPLFAIIGIGAHYGIDLTLKMNNKLMEQTDFSNLKFSLNGLPGFPAGFDASSILRGQDIPVYINRKDWKNTGINFGGKIYVDVLPFINALEVSTNFGVWQYDGSVLYPGRISLRNGASGTNFRDLVNIEYDTLSLTLKNLYPNRFFWGVTQTPYAKLHFDATLRKYILQVPPLLKTLKIYGGAGVSVDFATPMLSSQLIVDAIGSTLDTTLNLAQMGPTLFDNQAVTKKIIDQIINKMMTPHFGCHLDLGTMIKIPMIPIGFYVDGKFVIRFDKMDKYVDIGGTGLLLNFGVALAF
jgi:hypothetical protein